MDRQKHTLQINRSRSQGGCRTYVHGHGDSPANHR